ncbi:MAG: hypothetical protein KF794_06580 [Xanthobacteraceae bacterium]|nr:hypothetical protein [Xanthobacteraceae bacterium]QYK46335.1 MAG: hypothetical protein KF794_06580 [Xanthobacteraceae bacterium]HMN51371.1 hypothetical protein [Xanthobacteraceae bacterium]
MRVFTRLAALALMASTLPHNAVALTFAEQEFVCPIGGERFKSKVVASETRFGQRLDLKPVGALAAPHPLPVCPNGFVMFKQRFTQDEVAALTPVLLSPEYQAARKQHSTYYLAALLMEKNGVEPYQLAHVYLRASWQVEHDASPDRISLYRELAIARFDAFLKDNKNHDTRWWTAAIVAAELERNLGRFEQSSARLAGLPVSELKPESPQARAIEQIKQLIAEKKSQPERFGVK